MFSFELNIFYYLIINCLFSSNVNGSILTEEFMKKIYEYNQYKVIDVEHAQRGIDRLFTTIYNEYDQSGRILAHGFINLNNIDHVIMPHIQSIMGALFLLPNDNETPKRILIIGLGIGVLPRALTRLLNNSLIDAIEIDPVIFEIAKEYFFLRTSPNFNVHIGDGYDFVMNLQNNQTSPFNPNLVNQLI